MSTCAVCSLPVDRWARVKVVDGKTVHEYHAQSTTWPARPEGDPDPDQAWAGSAPRRAA